jgi:predicted glycoside hydrolase/deacetylase ChbG (UPF0249 family)
MALRALRGRLDLGDVERELRAQIERIRDGGVQVSHLDSHKHLHQLPGVATVVARLARHYGLERVRCTLEAGIWPAGVRASAVPSRLARRRLAQRASREFRAAGLRFPARTFDVRQLIAMRPDAGAALLRGLPPVTEMVCHPGTEAADREKPGSCARHAELRYLTSAAFRDALAATDVQLITYWDC